MYPNKAGTDYKYGSMIISLLKILDGTGLESLVTRRAKKNLPRKDHVDNERIKKTAERYEPDMSRIHI
jgi:hypothetical protein